MRPVRTAAVIGLVVLSAFAATAASASALSFRSTKEPEVITGEQDVSGINKFTVEKQVTECKMAKLKSASIATFPVKTLNLTPTWQLKAGECTSVLGFTSTPKEVEPEGCTIELLEPQAGLTGNLAIRCPSGKSIKLRGGSTFGTCEVRIGEAMNENLTGVTYTNSGGKPSKFSAKYNITNITANKTVDSGSCALSGTGVINTVSLTGVTVFSGEAGAEIEIK